MQTNAAPDGFLKWSGQTEESLMDDERARIGRRIWAACIKNHSPRVEWDAYARSYVITLDDGCYYWNPPK